MTKIFCDCCKNQITAGANTFGATFGGYAVRISATPTGGKNFDFCATCISSALITGRFEAPPEAPNA